MWMTLLTIELVAVLLAAWKAPAWVIGTGLIALVTGILGTVMGFFQVAEAVQRAGDVSPVMLLGGYRVALITFVYGLLILLVSLVIHTAQKPRYF